MHTIFESHISFPEGFESIDRHFGNFLAGLSGRQEADLCLAGALVAISTRLGHVCADLGALGNDTSLPELQESIKGLGMRLRRRMGEDYPVGPPGAFCPLILDEKDRLYLKRYHDYETAVIERLRFWAGQSPLRVDEKVLLSGLNRYFPEKKGETNSQRFAAKMALTRPFSLITGGPGTGKTSTVAKVLALFLEQNINMRIALCAPTGKAAAKLSDSIRKAKNLPKDHPAGIDCNEEIREKIPETASTIHRLLGAVLHSVYFRKNAENPLLADIVVVDETSMVDIALFAKLLDAIPIDARVLLLGDRDQLASVSAGNVFGDICDAGKQEEKPESEAPFLAKNQVVTTLTENYRFREKSGIHAAAMAVSNHGADNADANDFFSIFKDSSYPDTALFPLPKPGELKESLLPYISRWYENLAGRTPADIFAGYESFRILCAVRKGPYGVANINRVVEEALMESHYIHPFPGAGPGWYETRPVMILKNDYTLGLFNGDTGIALCRKDHPENLRVYFPESEPGANNRFPRQTLHGKTWKSFDPSRLPQHETAFAQTIHKSQGSEYDGVLMILPDHDTFLITKELIYTGITRAASRLIIFADEKILLSGIKRKVRRNSGLYEGLARP